MKEEVGSKAYLFVLKRGGLSTEERQKPYDKGAAVIGSLVTRRKFCDGAGHLPREPDSRVML